MCEQTDEMNRYSWLEKHTQKKKISQTLMEYKYN